MADTREQVYEQFLLGLARRACEKLHPRKLLAVGPDEHGDGGYEACVLGVEGEAVKLGWSSVSCADALAALLDDLGVDYPPLPSEKEVREASKRVIATSWRDGSGLLHLTTWRDLHARDDAGALMARLIVAGGS